MEAAVGEDSSASWGMVRAARRNLEIILSGVDRKTLEPRPDFRCGECWHQVEVFWSWFKYLQEGVYTQDQKILQEILARETRAYYPDIDQEDLFTSVRRALSMFLYPLPNPYTATKEERAHFVNYMVKLHTALHTSKKPH